MRLFKILSFVLLFLMGSAEAAVVRQALRAAPVFAAATIAYTSCEGRLPEQRKLEAYKRGVERNCGVALPLAVTQEELRNVYEELKQNPFDRTAFMNACHDTPREGEDPYELVLSLGASRFTEKLHGLSCAEQACLLERLIQNPPPEFS